MKATKARGHLSNSCGNCHFNNTFREDDDCLGCWNNPFTEYNGNKDKFKLNSEIEEELSGLERLAEIGKALELAVEEEMKFVAKDVKGKYLEFVDNRDLKNLLEWYRDETKTD